MARTIQEYEPVIQMVGVRDALYARHTCRDFKSAPVPREIVEKILEAALRAPSTANTQPWEIYVAAGEPLLRLRQAFILNHSKNLPPHPDIPLSHAWPAALQKRREEIMALHQGRQIPHPGETTEVRDHWKRNFEFFGAPVVIYLCMDKSLGFWSIFDLGLLSQSVMLEAKEWGLDTAPALMLVAYPDLIREELAIPKHLSVVFGIALGFSDEAGRDSGYLSPRRPLGEAVHFSGF
ncbi:MAG TPA: nitroreductase [bacterium]|nr:nitroreductase [bacterium]